MRARLELGDGATAADLVRFRAWLGRAPGVAEAGLRFDPAAPAAARTPDGTMSGSDAITLTCGVITALSSAVYAYATWRSAHSHPPTLIITVDGHTPMVFRDGGAAELKQLAEAEQSGPAGAGSPDDDHGSAAG